MNLGGLLPVVKSSVVCHEFVLSSQLWSLLNSNRLAASPLLCMGVRVCLHTSTCVSIITALGGLAEQGEAQAEYKGGGGRGRCSKNVH